MAKTYTPEELANLTDEEFMRLEQPDLDLGAIPQQETLTLDAPALAADPELPVDAGAADDPAPGDAAAEEAAAGELPAGSGEAETAGSENRPEAPADPDGSDTADQQGQDDTQSESAAVDYEAAYKQIMAPFKANGKMVTLQSPDEVIRLMQMGANYTKKLQALQPQLRMLRMLENNDLLNEDKISYLIDLEKKNPQAIQKLIKDSGIDPMDIDVEKDPGYAPGNHRVSDAEYQFSAVVQEVNSTPVGQQLISDINRTWDDQSKQALWEDPSIMRVLSDQRENGIYAQITAEIERRQMMGQLRTEPFIVSYRNIGQELQQQGRLVPTSSPSMPQAQQAPQHSRVLDTRTAKPKTAANNDKAKAASPVKSTAAKAAPDFNPLAMNDEEFEKHYAMATRL